MEDLPHRCEKERSRPAQPRRPTCRAPRLDGSARFCGQNGWGRPTGPAWMRLISSPERLQSRRSEPGGRSGWPLHCSNASVSRIYSRYPALRESSDWSYKAKHRCATKEFFGSRSEEGLDHEWSGRGQVRTDAHEFGAAEIRLDDGEAETSSHDSEVSAPDGYLPRERQSQADRAPASPSSPASAGSSTTSSSTPRSGVSRLSARFAPVLLSWSARLRGSLSPSWVHQ
jgi:hypothetical protein